MNRDSAVKMQAAVTMLPRLNSFLYLPLIETCGGIEGFFCEQEVAFEALLHDFNLKPEWYNRKEALAKAEKEIETMDKYGINICSIEHHNFPSLLRQCEDAPIVFFYKGQLETEEAKYIAIVGTRKASERCKEEVNTLVKGLSETGCPLIVVSGLAFGIDISAHKACLQYGVKTYSVLGHGLNTIYPAAHKNIAEQILSDKGALISEFPCCSSIIPANFLQRNRIIAGLSHATLVAESAIKGGAMSTARIALSYNREVMALPGRPQDKMSAGCNLLIKENIAALIENPEDVAKILGVTCKKQSPRQISLDLFDSGDQEALVIKILTGKEKINIDELSQATGITTGELCGILLKLELEGVIMPLPGKNYLMR